MSFLNTDGEEFGSRDEVVVWDQAEDAGDPVVVVRWPPPTVLVVTGED